MAENMHFSDLDQYLFGQGVHYDVYKKLGAHPTKLNGKKGVYFAVWAPNAVRVSVVGDFNGWDYLRNVMKLDIPIIALTADALASSSVKYFCLSQFFVY